LKLKAIKILALSLMAAGLYAQESAAEFILKKSLHVREEYNDNIFLSEDNRQEDFITTIRPSFKLVYTVPRVELAVDYGLNIRLYADHTDQNDTTLNRAQEAKLDTTLSLYKDLFFLKVYDEYTRVPIDQRQQVAIGNALVNMTDMNHLVVNPYVLYPVTGTLSAKASYIYEDRWYRDNPNSDFFNHELSLALIKELSQKVSSSVSYSYLFHRPKLFADRYNSQSATVGIEYQVTPKLLLSGSGGNSWIDYDSGMSSSDAIWNAALRYLVSARAAVSASFSEKFGTAVLLGTYKQRKASVLLEYTGTVPLTLTFFRNVDTYELVDREDDGTGAGVGSTFLLSPRLKGTVTANYTHYKFKPENNEIDRVGAGFSLVYEGRIGNASVGYTHNLSDATAAGASFRNNIIWAQAGATF